MSDDPAVVQTDRDIDPITLQVLWSRLLDIPKEMGKHLQRTAFSEVIKHNADFSTALFSWDGRLVSQGVFTPGHLGAMPTAMRKILDNHFAIEDIDPGDVIFTNDPSINAGHLPDFTTFEPVFWEGEIAGFCATTGHQIDIGGTTPGSMPMFTEELYEEGLQIPPIKLAKGGQINEEVRAVIEENSRAPEKLRGDMDAALGASRVAAENYTDLIEEYGFETVQRYIEEIIDRSELSMRRAIEDVGDGSFDFLDHIDGFDDDLLPIEVEVTIDGDEMVIDFEGTCDQLSSYAINSTLTYTSAYAIMAVKSALDPDTPQTHGSAAPIEVTAPTGSLLNPRLPAPVASRTTVSDRVVNVVNAALHQAMPGQIPAAGSEFYLQTIGFKESETNTHKILVDNIYGGAGARPDRDGYPSVAGGTNVQNVPVEVIETEYPMEIHQYEQVRDSSGAGKFRGGSGTVREYSFDASAEIVFNNDRYRTAPYGLSGGHDGKSGHAVLNPGSDNARELSSKTEITVEAGDVIRVYVPGGGGYGDPAHRELDSVRDDYQNGLISERIARETYGYEDDL